MIKKLKQKLIRWIDPSYEKEIKLKQKIIELEIKRQQALTEELQRLSLSDAIRRRYNSIEAIIAIKKLEDLPVEEREAYVAEAYTLSNSETLRYLMDLISNNLIEGIATKAENEEQMFFGRASLNGIYLLEEMIALLSGEYQENHTLEDNKDAEEELVEAI